MHNCSLLTCTTQMIRRCRPVAIEASKGHKHRSVHWRAARLPLITPSTLSPPLGPASCHPTCIPTPCTAPPAPVVLSPWLLPEKCTGRQGHEPNSGMDGVGRLILLREHTQLQAHCLTSPLRTFFTLPLSSTTPLSTSRLAANSRRETLQGGRHGPNQGAWRKDDWGGWLLAPW